MAVGLFALGLYLFPELRKFDPKVFFAVCFFSTYGYMHPNTAGCVKCRSCGKAQ